MFRALCLYATAYHLRLMRDADIEGRYVQIGHRPMGLRRRLQGLFLALVLGLVSPQRHVYLPRSATKDAWLIYSIFRRRTTLVSDGISDCLDFLPVLRWGPVRLGFSEPVAERFHVLAIRHPQREIHFAPDADVAVFTKRGRDVDYVTAAVELLCPDRSYVIDPRHGRYSRVFMPASTLVFELGRFPLDRLHIVACDFAGDGLPKDRLALLRSYEAFLEARGYSVIRRSEWRALASKFKSSA